MVTIQVSQTRSKLMEKVELTLIFDKDNKARPMGCDMPDTKNVPLTLIIQNLNNLISGLSKMVVDEAREFIPENELEQYLDARIKVDSQKYYGK